MRLRLELRTDAGVLVIVDEWPIEVGVVERLRDLGSTPVLDEAGLIALLGISIKTVAAPVTPTEIVPLAWMEE